MASAQIKFNARHGISVGSTPFSVLDNAGNATFNTISAGLWNGTIISGTYGGTGVNNGTKTITLGGNLVTSGAFNTTLTVGAATNVTLPASGTLATTANLSQFASTTSAQLKGIISDETGADGSSLVFANSPTLNTITVNGTNSASAITLGGGTVTLSKPPIDITQTWNDASVAFSGIKCVITNTASAGNSKVIDVSIGNNKFGVDGTGAITQILSNPNLARDIVGFTGSRHVREYQDLNDWNTVQGIGGATSNTENFEWGFTWNAKWDTTQVKYVKDRNNANDHAVMFRVDKKFRNQWWFSDGVTPGEISWVKKVDVDCPNNLFWTSMPITSGGFTTTAASSLGATSTGNLTVNGDFIVNGTSTTINTTELSVDDINITLGAVATPTDTTANGGGITLLGATNKTITWNQGTTNWDFSEHLNVATGKSFRINNNVVLNQTTLGSTVLSSSLTSVGVLSSGSISNGFGSINVGANTITAATGAFTTLSASTHVATGGADNTGFVMRVYTGGGYAAIYNRSVVPGLTNYTLASDGAISGINGSTTSRLEVARNTIAAATSTGLAVTGVISATSIQNTPIGSTTASTGAFTTLSASSSITGTLVGNSSTATAALGIKTATTTVSVSASTAPISGQILTATSGSVASWQNPPGSTTYTSTVQTATAGQTIFNISYTIGYIDVYQNGVRLTPADYTATTGTSVVLTTGATLNDELMFVVHTLLIMGASLVPADIGVSVQPYDPVLTSALSTSIALSFMRI